jgi:hypothetical protein
LQTDTWNINGIKVSGRYFDKAYRVGNRFEIISLDNGVLTLKDLK